jgi:hypothetical protein
MFEMATLDDIVLSAMKNQTIKDIILGNYTQNDPLVNALKPFVDFQERKYGGQCQNKTYPLVKQYGFQCAAPGIGDITKAKVLFVGPNPGFTVNMCNPRFFANDDNGPLKMFNGSNNEDITDDEATDFLRILNPMKDNRRVMRVIDEKAPCPTLTINIVNKDNKTNKNKIEAKPRGIRYWNDLVRKILLKLSPDDALPSAPNKPDPQKLDSLLEKTAFIEIIPFGSLGSEGVSFDTAYLCWEKFTEPFLKYSVAKVWIIVGGLARSLFSNIMRKSHNSLGSVFDAIDVNGSPTWNPVKSKEYEFGYIYRIPYDGGNRTILVIPHPNARKGMFGACVDDGNSNVNVKQISCAEWEFLRSII